MCWSDCVRINKQIWMSGGVRGWVYQCIFSFSAVIIIRLNCFSDYGQRNSWRFRIRPHVSAHHCLRQLLFRIKESSSYWNCRVWFWFRCNIICTSCVHFNSFDRLAWGVFNLCCFAWIMREFQINSQICGLLMRPLVIQREETKRPLLMNLSSNDKRSQLRQSVNSDYATRTRFSNVNLEPGVQSGMNLDELVVTPTPRSHLNNIGPRPPSPIPIPLHSRLGKHRLSIEKAPRAMHEFDDEDDDDTGLQFRTHSVNQQAPPPTHRRRNLSGLSDGSIGEIMDDENLDDGMMDRPRSPNSSAQRFRSRLTTEGSESSIIPRIDSFTTGGSEFQHGIRRPSFLRAVPSSSHPFSSGSIYGSTQLSVNSFAMSRKAEEEYGYLLSRGELSDITGRAPNTFTPTPAIIRPMSRKDIFYSGSIINLPEFHSNPSFLSYRQSIINLASDESDNKFADVTKSRKPGISSLLRKKADGAFGHILSQMVDLSLLCNPVFLLLACSGVVGMLGFYLPFVYGIDYSIKQGVSPQDAAFLISIVGIMNTFGRVFFGLISDLPYINSLLLNNICILIMGFCVGALPFCVTYGLILTVYVIFGLALSGFVSLTSIILVDLLGLDKLTNAFGLLIFFRGIASVIGTPLAGALYDAYGNYTIPFLVGASFLILSSLFGFVVPLAQRYSKGKIILTPLKLPQEGMAYAGPVLEDIIEEEMENQGKVQECHERGDDGNVFDEENAGVQDETVKNLDNV
ncbi:uncharacterized protein LOC110852292 isoform X2 [Folsomia candida]|uniref:uncharacterized protein LOC110852292 isoform X2 n=1 Tax=Folsomia candida TaxID=158441 RepID=UPI001604B988|nr:uncharacterized protein LOC110852292 isoform X2 [Folsomia candida]